MAFCYTDKCTAGDFDKSLLEQAEADSSITIPDVDLQKLLAENKALKEELTARRLEQQPGYVAKPLELSEYETRKIYIDADDYEHSKCDWCEQYGFSELYELI